MVNFRQYIGPFSLLLDACSSSDGPTRELIYIDKGAIQCEFTCLSLQDTGQTLTGIAVFDVPRETTLLVRLF